MGHVLASMGTNELVEIDEELLYNEIKKGDLYVELERTLRTFVCDVVGNNGEEGVAIT